MSESDELPESPARSTFTVAFVVGVSADKWARVWAERMPHLPLVLRLVDDAGALEALDGDADMTLARLPLEIDADVYRAIPLWTEMPVVVAPKDHPISVVDSVTLAELEDENLLEGRDDDALDLVAAGVGVARMPQSVFRATGRRDVKAREISDAEPTRIALVWKAGPPDDSVDEFVGIVRGRTAQSSRGTGGEAAAEPEKKTERRQPPRGPAAKAKPVHRTGLRALPRSKKSGGKRRPR
ncbi:LysR family transcriptional regulator substrate-binding protein [Amnibacterium flavum]|uniref:LysR family transcriptional regulator substrate-binding protein n=1 Tax=Amnibacterium flavum TaxID=2173173 RepID=UPI001402ABD8|nr:LysR family transcriptional regulator substrate-binding protein [Amnibacterium flavum]